MLSMSALIERLKAALKDPVSGQLLRGSGLSMAIRVVGLVIGFLSHMVLSRTLGADQYGQYAVALGWALVLVLPARLGLDNAALRLATIYVEEDRLGQLRGLIRFAAAVMTISSLIIAAALLALHAIGFSLFRGATATILLWMIAIIFPLAALGVVSVLLRAARRILASQVYEQLLRPVVLIAGCGAFALTRIELSASAALMITAVATGVALAGALLHFRTVFPNLSRHPPETNERGQWLSLSWPLFLIGTVQEVMNQIDIILLGQLASTSEAGHYAAAWRLASLVVFALVAITAISAPMIAWAHRRNDRAELARIARLNARLALAFSLGMTIFLAAIGPYALRLFGPGFDDAYPALLVLLLAGMVNAFTGSVAYLMTMTGRQQLALAIFGSSLLVSIVLNVLLIPPLGTLGAAIASASGTILWNVAMLVYVRRQFGIDASAFGFRVRSE
ncbi:MAG TPA: flippase [Allosphingosinicella sp.]|jgi:O-antigen/teichoic acid export membrane protein